MGLKVVAGREYALLHQHALQRVDEVEQVLGVRVADVVDAMRRERQPVLAHLHFGRGVHDAPDALDDIVDVGEVAAAVAHVEDLDGVAAAQLLGEAEVGHVRPAHGAVHREEAQAGGRDGVELGVGGGHELVGLLGGGVQRHRRVHVVVLAERHLLVASVDARRRGVHEMLNRVVPAGLQYVEESDEVAVHVRLRVLNGVAYARLCSKVHNDIEPILRKETLNKSGIAQITPNKGEAALGIRLGKHVKACLLNTWIVVAVEIVDTDNDIVGTFEQLLNKKRTDETCRTRYQYFSSHIPSPYT